MVLLSSFSLSIHIIYFLANRSTLHPQPPPQVVHSATRTNTMPNWRGHLPMQHEPVTIDEYQITASFSRKAFLGGIPTDLSEGDLLI